MNHGPPVLSFRGMTMPGKYFILFFLFMGLLAFFGGCATLPEGFEKPVSYTYPDTEDTALAEFKRSEKDAHGEEASGFYLLGSGLDAFAARAVLARRAERSIDVQYYLYHSDLVGKLLTDQLVQAADRGVRVRILLDDIGMGGKDLVAATLDSHPNIEVRLLNPFVRKGIRSLQFLTRYSAATRRMHNKSFTADSQMTILGGRNIGDTYFNADHAFFFADLDVLCIGPVVEEVSGAFDLYWNSELAYPVSALTGHDITPETYREKRKALSDFIESHSDSLYLAELKNSDLVQKIRSNRLDFEWGAWDLVYDLPEKLLQKKSEADLHVVTQLMPLLDELAEGLIIFSPYFVPTQGGVERLAALVKRGVRVRILTNSLASTNHAIVHSGYSKYRKKLLRAGIEIYELNKKICSDEEDDSDTLPLAVLHAKTFIFDRTKVFVGSLNLDPLAFYNNTEMGVVMTQAEMAGRLADWFDENIDRLAFRVKLVKDENGAERIRWYGHQNGEEVIYTREPNAGFWKRFGIGFMRLLPIDHFL